jgi:hypothetical protein
MACRLTNKYWGNFVFFSKTQWHLDRQILKFRKKCDIEEYLITHKRIQLSEWHSENVLRLIWPKFSGGQVCVSCSVVTCLVYETNGSQLIFKGGAVLTPFKWIQSLMYGPLIRNRFTLPQFEIYIIIFGKYCAVDISSRMCYFHILMGITYSQIVESVYSLWN